MKKIMCVLAAVLLSLSVMGQGFDGSRSAKVFRLGADVSADCFLPASQTPPPSVGVGLRARYGRPDQLVNLVGGIRYIYGQRLSGFQVPVMANLNLLRFDRAAAYLGGGYEFDFFGRYWGCTKFQGGLLLGPHFDFRVFYKPYQADLGVGVTYFF